MLVITPNLTKPDESYAGLIAAHDGLSEEESHALNARLILILMNHIGDAGVLEEALALARRHQRSPSYGPGKPVTASRDYTVRSRLAWRCALLALSPTCCQIRVSCTSNGASPQPSHAAMTPACFWGRAVVRWRRQR